ncbi:MAG: cysteine hydrolase family protein [Actinomycetales bacterium]
MGKAQVLNALVVIDVQVGFADPFWGRRCNPKAEENIEVLVSTWRSVGQPIVLVRHDSVSPGSPLRPSQAGNALLPSIDGAHDLFVTKSVNSAFYGTPNLDAWLKASQIDALTICGITTNHCCETTARMAGNLGYQVTFALDATYTFDRIGPDGTVVPAEDLMRATAANLHGEFATITSSAQVCTAVAR